MRGGVREGKGKRDGTRSSRDTTLNTSTFIKDSLFYCGFRTSWCCGLFPRSLEFHQQRHIRSRSGFTVATLRVLGMVSRLPRQEVWGDDLGGPAIRFAAGRFRSLDFLLGLTCLPGDAILTARYSFFFFFFFLVLAVARSCGRDVQFPI